MANFLLATHIFDIKPFLFSILDGIIWVFIGLALMGFGYFVVSRITPFDDAKELEKGNTAVAVFLGSFIIAIAIIIAACIS